MPAKKRGGTVKKKSLRTVRASVSLRPDLYHTIEAIARQKRVSAAWVLRDAVENYVAAQWPLLEKLP